MDVADLDVVRRTLKTKQQSETAKKCDVIYLESSSDQGKKGRYIVNLLHRTFSVEWPEMRVIDLVSGKQAAEQVSIIALSYLLNGDGSSAVEGWVPFENIKGAAAYLPEFKRRSISPLTQNFGSNPKDFEKACISLGGKRERLAALSFSFTALPRIRILCQLWRAVKEDYVPAAANISFSRSAPHYLPPRELGALGRLLVEWLSSAVK